MLTLRKYQYLHRMIDLPWSLILWCCWSTNLNTSAGDVYLADSAAMLTRREASTFRLLPRFTCFPPRATSTQVPLVQAKYTTDSTKMLTRRKASTPRLSSQCSCLPPRQHCIEVALRGKQVHLGCRISELALLLVQLQLNFNILGQSQWCTWLGLRVLELSLPSKHPQL